MFGLTRKPVGVSEGIRLADLAKAAGVIFVPITFADVVNTLRSVCEHDQGLTEVVEDYEDFLYSEGLLGDTMVAFPARYTIEVNRDFRLFYQWGNNPSKAQSKFIGFYTEKCVRYVGKLETVVVGVQNETGVVFEKEEVGTLSDSQHERIEQAIEASQSIYPEFAWDSHRYYLRAVEDDGTPEKDLPREANFEKVGFEGMRLPRVFNVPDSLSVKASGLVA